LIVAFGRHDTDASDDDRDNVETLGARSQLANLRSAVLEGGGHLLSNTGSGLVVAFTAVYEARVHHHGSTAGALAVAAVAAGCVPKALAGPAADRPGCLVVLAGGWVVAATGGLAMVACSGTVALLAAGALVGRAWGRPTRRSMRCWAG
jgi:hypothetical protein